jgi:tetratricopeptide (TPR) repeat protein
MAGVLMTGGYPTEAKRILEQGLSANLLQGEAGTRAQTTLERAKSGAAADAKEIPGAAQALAAAKTGNEMVATGKLYFSVADYPKAIDAFRKGLAKGGVTDVDDANALLGIALARSGDYPAAIEAFDAVKDPALAEIAGLWKLHAGTKATPPVPAAAG